MINLNQDPVVQSEIDYDHEQSQPVKSLFDDVDEPVIGDLLRGDALVDDFKLHASNRVAWAIKHMENK